MGKKDKNPADVYRPRMEAAATTAETISPFEKELNEYNMKLWNMYTGKEKFDLSKMPNASALMPMYEGAKAKSDRGRIGKGLSYGGQMGEQGYNPTLIAAIDEQNQSERERDAAGMLEQRVADTFGGIGAKMAGMGESDQDRRNQNFNRYAQMYGMEIGKPRKQKWWETLLGGAAEGAVGWGLSALAV